MFHGLWHGVMKAAYSGPERIQVQGHDKLGRVDRKRGGGGVIIAAKDDYILQ